MQAGAPGRWSQARSGAESGQSPGAERPQWRGAEGAPSPHPIPPYSLLEGRTLHQDDTPFPTGSLQDPPWRPSGLGGKPPGLCLSSSQPAIYLLGPLLHPHAGSSISPLSRLQLQPLIPYPHLTPPVQQPLKYRLNLAHTCLNLLEFLLAP